MVEVTVSPSLTARGKVGFVWQDRTGGSQPTFYLVDIALSNGILMCSAAPADGTSGVVTRVQVNDPQGLSDIARPYSLP
jgi:hypothetical protein